MRSKLEISVSDLSGYTPTEIKTMARFYNVNYSQPRAIVLQQLAGKILAANRSANMDPVNDRALYFFVLAHYYDAQHLSDRSKNPTIDSKLKLVTREFNLFTKLVANDLLDPESLSNVQKCLQQELINDPNLQDVIDHAKVMYNAQPRPRPSKPLTQIVQQPMVLPVQKPEPAKAVVPPSAEPKPVKPRPTQPEQAEPVQLRDAQPPKQVPQIQALPKTNPPKPIVQPTKPPQMVPLRATQQAPQVLAAPKPEPPKQVPRIQALPKTPPPKPPAAVQVLPPAKPFDEKIWNPLIPSGEMVGPPPRPTVPTPFGSAASSPDDEEWHDPQRQIDVEDLNKMLDEYRPPPAPKPAGIFEKLFGDPAVPMPEQPKFPAKEMERVPLNLGPLQNAGSVERQQPFIRPFEDSLNPAPAMAPLGSSKAVVTKRPAGSKTVPAKKSRTKEIAEELKIMYPNQKIVCVTKKASKK